MPLHFFTFYIQVDFADAFIQSDLQPFIDTFTHRSGLANHAGQQPAHREQSHLDAQLGGAGNQTSILLVASQPNLPPELLPDDPCNLFHERTKIISIMKAFR